MNDLASAISGSLSRDGLGGMRAPLDMGGFKPINLADGTNATDAATVGQLTAIGGSLPVGSVLDYAGSTAPTGFLLLFGQAVSRTTYTALFAILGTNYGPGDGSTTFNLPDARGRAIAGKDDMGGTNANRLSGYSGTSLGAGFGVADHVLTTPQIPSHSHGVTDPTHSHSMTLPQRGGNNNASSAPAAFVTDDFAAGNATGSTNAVATGISIQNTGGGGAHPNVQPTLILNKIMKAL